MNALKTTFSAIIIAFSLFIVANLSAVSAETDETLMNTEELGQKSFELEMSTEKQSIFDYSLPVQLKIKSLVTSEKIQIRWQVPSGLELKGDTNYVWTQVNKGDEVTASVKIIPQKSGEYKLIAEVQAWQADGNYLDTKSIDLKFANNLEVQPQSEEFYRDQRNWLFARIGIGIAVTLLLLIGAKIGYQKFQKWLNED